MSRLLILTRDAACADAIAAHLSAIGGVGANLTGPVHTVIMPMLGRVTITCIVCHEATDRLLAYGDAVGVVMITDEDDENLFADLEVLVAISKRTFPHLPVGVGVPADAAESIPSWLLSALGRQAGETPIYTIDPANRSDIITLLASVLCIANESQPAV